ncbi:MAG: chloride channel protein, partial [Oscillospiraceae bacterium]|nr:chloride channel protein [Oscillospiraceae bacterium]
MNTGKTVIKELNNNIRFGLKWILISIVLGSVCGVVGAAFHHAIDYVTHIRLQNSFLIWLMPLGGMLIV